MDLAAVTVGGLGLLHSRVTGKRLISQHVPTHIKIMAEAQQQEVQATRVRVTRHALLMEAQGRASISARSFALRSLFD